MPGVGNKGKAFLLLVADMMGKPGLFDGVPNDVQIEISDVETWYDVYDYPGTNHRGRINFTIDYPMQDIDDVIEGTAKEIKKPIAELESGA